MGCGLKRFEGYLNIDLHNSDRDMDIRKLDFGNDTADEIIAIHVFEHFYLLEAGSVLKEWYRVLKKGGKLILELPCYDKVIELIKQGAPDNMTRWALFGDPRTHIDGEPALHKWCWYMDELINLLTNIGFDHVNVETPKFHVPSRDMRLVAYK